MKSGKGGVVKRKRSVAWKAFERCVARAFGSQRTALSGGNSKITRSDTLHDHLFIECKYGKSVPGWALFEKTAELAEKEDKIPVVAVKLANRSDDETLITVRLKDLLLVATYTTSALLTTNTTALHCTETATGHTHSQD